ncbi:MAG: RNA-binding protein [Kiritimatiellae bacterium]|nr:RNA-binding protein [Kiritimatiellia bacterium]
MQCINEVIGLFNGPSCCPAVSLAVAAFVAGAVFAFVLRLLVHPCKCRKNGKGGCRQSRREDRPFEKRKPHPAPADGSVEIYVGNLSYDMTEEQLRREFEAYGTVNSARLITNRYNGKSKGFGFVQMPNREEAEKACAELNDKDIMGRRMKCNEAKNLI